MGRKIHIKTGVSIELVQTNKQRKKQTNKGIICEIQVRFNKTVGKMGKRKQAMTQVKIHVKESKTYYPTFAVKELRLLFSNI